MDQDEVWNIQKRQLAAHVAPPTLLIICIGPNVLCGRSQVSPGGKKNLTLTEVQRVPCA